jgi:hypothetical protein
MIIADGLSPRHNQLHDNDPSKFFRVTIASAFLLINRVVIAAGLDAGRPNPRHDKTSRTIFITLAFCARLPNKLSCRDHYSGEGRCPVVPLVFKTSLGAVRSPEGSTPSLLRQKQFCRSGDGFVSGCGATGLGTQADGRWFGAHVIALVVAAIRSAFPASVSHGFAVTARRDLERSTKYARNFIRR